MFVNGKEKGEDNWGCVTLELKGHDIIAHLSNYSTDTTYTMYAQTLEQAQKISDALKRATDEVAEILEKFQELEG